MLLALVLVTVAVFDTWGLAARRQWPALTVSAGLWLVGIALAVSHAAGLPLPSLSRLLVDLLRPVSAWVP